MTYEQGSELLMNAVRGFHCGCKKMFGQIALKLDNEQYISTGGNKLLSQIREEDGFEICDINTGDLGQIFKHSQDSNAFIFGCSADIVEVSETLDKLPASLEDLAQIAGPYVEVIPDSLPGNILKATNGSGSCLIKGCGVVTIASNLKKAVAAVQIIEKSCQAYVHGKMIGGAIPFNEETAQKLHHDFMHQYVHVNQEPYVDFTGFNEEEFALRNKIIECGKDLVRKDLVYGCWGNISAKLNDHEMLITPTAMDYFTIKIEDIVKVNLDTLDYGRQRVFSTEANVHARLYKDFPDCRAIIHTHSNGISVFAACEAGFTIDNPELKDIIGDIKVANYAFPGKELEDSIASALCGTHSIIVAHHGAFFYGESLDIVFAVAEAVEKRAQNILQFNNPEPASESMPAHDSES
ncbi:MAG TPA: class II aldolase/adducin family protein [Mogibacterium sp.]|nr:class II aldolase/adducin family protein [Mogibacterium sp.]